tara:strand:- start:31 stop:402 length:372 start_codon:yes stop_codon:yes gene_type:complete
MDGTTAITLTESENPDLVLLDLRLPELDGFQVCQRLKGHPDTGHIPIIMVTALTATPDKVKGLMYGADEYLVNPADLRHLQENVGKALRLVRDSAGYGKHGSHALSWEPCFSCKGESPTPFSA